MKSDITVSYVTKFLCRLEACGMLTASKNNVPDNKRANCLWFFSIPGRYFPDITRCFANKVISSPENRRQTTPKQTPVVNSLIVHSSKLPWKIYSVTCNTRAPTLFFCFGNGIKASSLARNERWKKYTLQRELCKIP